MKTILNFLHHRETGCSRLPGGEQFFKSFLEELASNPSQNQACELTGQSRATFLMDFSPDGSKIASTHGDHTVRVTDIATGKCTHILTGHPRTPWTLAFHPSFNGILASGCLGGEVRIWDLHGGGSEAIHSRTNKVISSLAFHPTDHVLVFATGSAIYFWDWSEPKPFVLCKTAHEYEKVRWLRFDPLGHYLYTGIANDSTIQTDSSSSVSYISNDSSGRPSLGTGGNAHYQRIVNRWALRQNRSQDQNRESRTTDEERPHSPVHEEGLRNARQYASGITNISRAQEYASRVTQQHAEHNTEQNRQNIFPTTGALRAQHSPENSNMYSLWGTLPTRPSNDSTNKSERDRNILSDDIAPGPSAHVNRRSLLHRTSHSASFFSRDEELHQDHLHSVLRRIRSRPRQSPTVVIVGRPVSSNASLENSPSLQVETRQFRNGQWSIVPSESISRDPSEPTSSAVNLTPLLSASTERTQTAEINNNVSIHNSNLSRSGVESVSIRSTFSDQSLSDDSFRTPVHSTYCDGFASGENNSLQNLTMRSDSSRGNQNDLFSPEAGTSAIETDSSSENTLHILQGSRRDIDTPYPSRNTFTFDLSNQHTDFSSTAGDGNPQLTNNLTDHQQTNSLNQRGEALTSPAVRSTGQSTHGVANSVNMSFEDPSSGQPSSSSLSSNTTSAADSASSSSDVSHAQTQHLDPCSHTTQSASGVDQTLTVGSCSRRVNRSRDSSNSGSSNTSILLQSLANLSRGRRTTSSSDLLNRRLHARRSARRQQSTDGLQENLSEPREDFLTITARLEQEVQELQTRLTNLRQSFHDRVRQIRESHDGISHRIHLAERQLEGADSSTEMSASNSSTSEASSLPMIVITESRGMDTNAPRDPGAVPVDAHRANQSHERPPPLLETALRHVNQNILPTSSQQSEVQVLNPSTLEPGQEQRNWHSMQRHHLHPHYAVSILDETINRPNDALQTAINRAIAGAFMGTGEPAVASNIINQSYRIQRWDFQHCNIPDISDSTSNIVVPHCKLHNDASCDISVDGSLLSTFVPSHRGFPDDNILAVFSLRPESLGQCLFTKSFGPNAISTSLSPNNSFLMVGLASKKLTWVFTPKQMVGQIFKLAKEGSGENSMKHIKDILHSCDVDNRTHISINSARWLPGCGEGVVYGTNKGHLHICRPGNEKRVTDDAGVTAVPSELSGQLPLFQLGERASSSTQTNEMWRSLGTQTESREGQETRDSLPNAEQI